MGHISIGSHFHMTPAPGALSLYVLCFVRALYLDFSECISTSLMADVSVRWNARGLRSGPPSHPCVCVWGGGL